jgi:hypothetical protein
MFCDDWRYVLLKAAIFCQGASERKWGQDYCHKKGWSVVDTFDTWSDPEALPWLVSGAGEGAFEVVVSQSGAYTDRKTGKPGKLAELLAGTPVKVQTSRAQKVKPIRKATKFAPDPDPETTQARIEARKAQLASEAQENAARKAAFEEEEDRKVAARLARLRAIEPRPLTPEELAEEREIDRMIRYHRMHKWPCPTCEAVERYGVGKRYDVNKKLTCKECATIFTPAEFIETSARARLAKYEAEREALLAEQAREAARRDAFGNLVG